MTREEKIYNHLREGLKGILPPYGESKIKSLRLELSAGEMPLLTIERYHRMPGGEACEVEERIFLQ